MLLHNVTYPFLSVLPGHCIAVTCPFCPITSDGHRLSQPNTKGVAVFVPCTEQRNTKGVAVFVSCTEQRNTKGAAVIYLAHSSETRKVSQFLYLVHSSETRKVSQFLYLVQKTQNNVKQMTYFSAHNSAMFQIRGTLVVIRWVYARSHYAQPSF